MFSDRQQAGKLLGEKLSHIIDTSDTIVIGIPRGGIVTGIAVSSVLKAPFDVLVVKKIASPFNPELAIGAVGLGSNKQIIKYPTLRQATTGLHSLWQAQGAKIVFQEALEKSVEVVKKRVEMIRAIYLKKSLKGKEVIIVDDGVATGATVITAAEIARKEGAEQVLLATPVIAKETYLQLQKHFDAVITLEVPDEFYAVGQFYREFPQVRDEEMIALLKQN